MDKKDKPIEELPSKEEKSPEKEEMIWTYHPTKGRIKVPVKKKEK